MNPLEFIVAVAFEINPLLFPIWVTGLVYLFVSKETKLHRWAGIFWLVVMGILVFTGSAKSYYANPSFPVLIATGALAIERLVDRGKKWRWVPPVTVVYTVIALLIAMPFAVPVLPVQDYISFARKTGMNLETGEQNEQGVLPQFFADRFGWEKLAQKTAAVYQALPDSDKTDCVIFTTNYGRAASLEYYTEEYDLPPVICGHNSYWHWGPGDYNGKVMIVVDNQGQERLGEFFEETEEKGRTNHPLSMPYEQNVHIYVCRNLREPLKAIWPILKIFI